MIGAGVLKKIPQFVKADTPESLREQMLKSNIRHKGELHFFDIQFVGGSWHAWFIPIDTMKEELPRVAEAFSINGPAVRKR